MSFGLVIGLVLAVIGLCIIIALLSWCWTKKRCTRQERRKTQIHVLPPPVQADCRDMRSTPMMENSRIQPLTLPQIPEPNAPDSTNTVLVRPGLETDLEPGPERHPRVQPPPRLAIRPRAISALHTSTPFSELSAYSPAFPPSPDTRRPSASTAWMMETIEAFGPVKPPSPVQPEQPSHLDYFPSSLGNPVRSNTGTSSDYSFQSPIGSVHNSLETPVVRTAVAYNRAHSRDLPRASMIRVQDERTSGSLPLAQVPTAYVPYRPPPSSG